MSDPHKVTTWFVDLAVGDCLSFAGVRFELQHKSGTKARIKVTAPVCERIDVERKIAYSVGTDAANKRI